MWKFSFNLKFYKINFVPKIFRNNLCATSLYRCLPYPTVDDELKDLVLNRWNFYTHIKKYNNTMLFMRFQQCKKVFQNKYPCCFKTQDQIYRYISFYSFGEIDLLSGWSLLLCNKNWVLIKPKFKDIDDFLLFFLTWLRGNYYRRNKS